MKLLAADAGVKIRAAQMSLRWAEKHGIIRIIPQMRADGSAASNKYQFIALTPPAPDAPPPALDAPLEQIIEQSSQIDKRSAALTRAELWDRICGELGVKSAVSYPDGYWGKVTKVPTYSPALSRLIRQLLVFQPQLVLSPGSVSRLEATAEIVDGLELSQPMHLQELDTSPDCLQDLAVSGTGWAKRVKKYYGRWYYEDDIDVRIREEDEMASFIAARDRRATPLEQA